MASCARCSRCRCSTNCCLMTSNCSGGTMLCSCCANDEMTMCHEERGSGVESARMQRTG